MVLRSLLFSSEYTLRDRVNFFRGVLGSTALLMQQVFALNLFRQAPRLEVPVYFVLGRHDHEVPSTLSAEYFDALEAPKKALFWFENSAHMPNIEERDRFNQLLLGIRDSREARRLLP